MAGLDAISKALSSPGPQTDHSIHTTQQLPAHPMPTGAIHTNQKTPDSGSMDALKAGMNKARPY